MKNINLKPEYILYAFIGIYLVIGSLIAKDYSISADEPIERTRASIALTKYGINMGYLRFDDYDDIGHSQFYGTATSMLLVLGTKVLSPILNLPEGILMHYGYFITFQIAIIAFFYLAKIFVPSWTALFTSILFATQPLFFGHALMNPKDIPLLAVFLLSVTTGFYIDRHRMWQQNVNSEIDLPNLFQEWKKFLFLLPRTTYRNLLLFPAVLVLIFLLKPILTNLLNQIIITAYTDPQSLWGMILIRIAANLSTTPLEAYLNKGMTNLIRLLNLASALSFLGFLAYCVRIYWKGFKQLPQDIQDRSVFRSLSLNLKNHLLILAALSYGFAISTRIVAIFAGGIVALYLLGVYRKKAVVLLAIYGFFSSLFAYLSWPIFWRYGIAAVSKALSLFSDFDPYFGSILFMGKIYSESEVPRNYIPRLLLLQFTEPVIILCVSGFFLWIIFLARERKWSQQDTRRLLVFLWFALPVTYVVVTTPILYNNFRQFIFITPPLFIFAAIALQFLQERIKYRFVFPLLLPLIFLPGILNLFSLHPYQYIYYNQFTGGVKGAFRNYDLDYFYNYVKEGMEYIDQNAPKNTRILIWDVEFWKAVLYNNRPDIFINRVAHVTEEEYSSYQWALIPTLRNYDRRVPETWKPIYTGSRNGAILFVIYEINGE